jgi:hypothetical protein
MTASSRTYEIARASMPRSPGRRAKALTEMREPVVANNRAGGLRELAAL